MSRLAIEKEKAILNLKKAKETFKLSRYYPTDKLAFFVNHYWIVRWDLTGQKPYAQEILPHPCVNLVIQKNSSRIGGVTQKKFSYLLSDKGIVFAVMFRPAGFYPFLKTSLSTLTNKQLSLQAAFGTSGKALETKILSQDSDEKMVAIMEKFLLQQLPEKDKNVAMINQIVETIASDQNIFTVDQIVERFTISKRTLQRLFKHYVGVGPKWIIKRYRLMEAAEQLKRKPEQELGKLAVEVGYFDQAHFDKDFKDMLGKSPLEYKKILLLNLGGDEIKK